MSQPFAMDSQGKNNRLSLGTGFEENDCNEDKFNEDIAFSCFCPCCGEITVREVKKHCYEQECPKCGTGMIRNWYD